MNAISLFKEKALLHPFKLAIADIKNGEMSFGELKNLSAKAQSLMMKQGIGQNDSVVMALAPSPEMYAFVCGLLGLGVQIVFIEPWLKPERINEIINTIKPAAFISGGLGKIWGMRARAIRQIPLWISPKDLSQIEFSDEFIATELVPGHHAFVVFSSGTTGTPKGAVRTHEYLKNIFDIFIRIEPEDFETPDLAVFPNVALFHLATGRGAIIVPHRWSENNFKKLKTLVDKYKPETVSTGPAFLKKIFDLNLTTTFGHFKRVVIGGALTDCWLMEKAINEFPTAKVLHIYGGSEAEPIAVVEAKKALKQSLSKGYFQVLCLGKPIDEIQFKFKEDILWVTGPNVAREYIGDPRDNLGVKERDDHGVLWHNMGDRAELSDGLLWIKGRANQPRSDFELEQSIYTFLNSSQCFIHRSSNDQVILFGDKVEDKKVEISSKFPQINNIINSPIKRDRRHRSRIDRQSSLPKEYRTKTMSTFSKWMTYLKERSPLPALIILSAIGAISSLAFKQNFDLILFLCGIVFNTLIFIQLRLGDEVKDFEKDKIVNPTRPLPRGLLTPGEVLRAMNGLVAFLLLASGILSYFYHPLGGLFLALSTLFGWLMYHEFFIGESLNKSPILYALTHQVIVFFIYGWIGLSSGADLIQQKVFAGWLLANFGASFTYEICRKLNPNAHAMAQTYAQHYGPTQTVFITTIFITIMGVGSFITGFGLWMILPLLLLEVMLLQWIKKPESYKKIEGFAALCGLIVALAPALMWFIESRK